MTATDRTPIPELCPSDRLPVGYHLCTTRHASGAKAVLGAAAAIVAAIHPAGRQN